jgi:hypothetical protein
VNRVLVDRRIVAAGEDFGLQRSERTAGNALVRFCYGLGEFPVLQGNGALVENCGLRLIQDVSGAMQIAELQGANRGQRFESQHEPGELYDFD